jgi:hypothetical protein
MRFRKKSYVIRATQWFQNGDHPEDRVGEQELDSITDTLYTIQEGRVVRFFRRPEEEYRGDLIHDTCGRTWQDHGWVDTLEGGHTVCPGDWVITGVCGEYYPCKDKIFQLLYEPVEG